MRVFILTLFFLLITAPMLWGVANAGPVEFTGCSRTSCKALVPTKHNTASLVLFNIVSLSDSPECPGRCSNLTSTVGKVHVLGNYRDIACKTWGGFNCIRMR